MQTRSVLTSLGEMVAWDTADPSHDGPTLVLLHGLPTCKELWHAVVPELPGSWRVVVPDLPDFGESAKVGRLHTHADRARALHDLLQGLGVEQFALVAHDLGASVAVQYLGDIGQDDVERLVLMSPPVYPDFRKPWRVTLTRLPGVGEIVAPVAKNLMLRMAIQTGLVNKGAYTGPLRESMEAAFAGSSGTKALLRDLRWGNPPTTFAPYPATLRSLRMPTMVMHGRGDVYIPHDHIDRLHDDIPDVRVRWIEHGGHFLSIDTPVEVARLITAFLA